jgi:hopene-associated glycosyltransferase HpnB
MVWTAAATLSLVIWMYLVFARGGFWRARTMPPCNLRSTRRVVAVIPARNEANVIGEALTSLFTQYFLAPLQIVLVDDGSSDGTAEVARSVARQLAREKDLTVLSGAALPEGWTGKLWAVSQGTQEALKHNPDFLLFTDADIHHDGRSVADLIAKAEAEELDLTSHMVRLSTTNFAEEALIPAFVYFFLQLYPPAWIAAADKKTAGAAGGCILLRPSALARIGGHAVIRSQIIDDCALARAVKSSGGKIWMGLSASTQSIRPYSGFAEIFRMISRSAFNQLQHSAWLLAGTLLGLALTYVVPIAALFSGRHIAERLGLAAWLLMSISYAPMTRLYRLPPLFAFTLPIVAVFYAAATFHSAVQYWRGQGGVWKGRVQDA